MTADKGKALLFCAVALLVAAIAATVILNLVVEIYSWTV